MKDVSVRFRPGLPLVLKKLNIEIPSRSKVGIIGRTGSGKSTLMLVLTRLLEVEEGTIELDKLDTKTLGLHSVRQNISVIPQDPFLLQGTLKDNVDPYGQYSDEEVLASLRAVDLLVTIKDK